MTMECSSASCAAHLPLWSRMEALRLEYADRNPRRRGNTVVSAEDASLLERANRIKAQELLANDLCGTIASSQRSASSAQEGQKRRRLMGKRSCDADVYREVAYAYNHERRSRRYSVGTAAQGMDRRVQKHVLKHTVDLDVVNCMLQILHQAVERVDVVDKEAWKEELQTLRELSTDRRKVCDDELSVPVSVGKDTILCVVNGGAIPESLKSNQYAQRISRLGRFLRWLSVSLLPDMFASLKMTMQRKWPEATRIALFSLSLSVDASCMGRRTP